MQNAKVQLSADELELMQNAGWILTKNRVLDKLSEGLLHLGENMQQILKVRMTPWPPALTGGGFKISKGEKYQGLPYLILDYPRLFSRDEIFAVRTLFWWGHFYSMTLHARGSYAQAVLASIKRNWKTLQETDLLLCVSGDEWNHDTRHLDYRPLKQLDYEELERVTEGNAFIKLSKQLPLEPWAYTAEKLVASFHQLTDFIIL